jgi:adenine-specific DNA-methyltransferase
MLPRLYIARNLLREDGVIFVSCDDNEVHNLRLLMNEVFGEENFIDCIVWKKRYGGGAKEKYLVTVHEYVLFYARSINSLPTIEVETSQESIDRYYTLKDENHEVRGAYRTHPLEATKSMGHRPNLVFPISAPDGTIIHPKRQWLWSRERVESAIKSGELAFLKDKDGGWSVHSKQYLRDEMGQQRTAKAFSLIDDVFTQHGTNEIIELFGDAQIFSFPKPTRFLEKILDIGLNGDSDALVMDFFSGSASFFHAVAEKNFKDNGSRKAILVQLPETTEDGSAARDAGFCAISEISRERMRRVLDRHTEGDGLLKSGEAFFGFKSFLLSPSNFKQWRGDGIDTPEQLAEQMHMFAKAEKEGAQVEDMLYELLLKFGQELTTPIETLDVAGVAVFAIHERQMLFVLEPFMQAMIEPLVQLKPREIIAIDGVFNDSDMLKTNLDLQCRDAGIRFTCL